MSPFRAGSERHLILAVAGFAAALFAVVIGNDFVLDDAWLIRDNPLIRSLGSLPRLFASDYWEPRLHAGLYRPLVTTSYALNHAVGGLDPRGYHAVNLLLHAANSALVLHLLHRWTGRLPLATAAAFLFAAHAVHVEVLANVASGRPELLAACFGLLALAGYRPARPVAREPGPAWPSLPCFGLALLSKEHAITLLAVLPVVDGLLGQGGTPSLAGARSVWTRRAGVYAAYGAVALAYLGLRWLALGDGDALPAHRDLDNPLLLVPPGWRVVNALQVAFRYALLLLWPGALSYDYSFDQIPLIRSPDDLRLHALLGLCGLAGWGLVAAARRSRPAFLGLAFALLTFSVASNLVVPIGTIMAERLLYLPSVGFCLAAAVGLDALARRLARTPGATRRIFLALTAVLVALHSVRAIHRSLDWRTENGLYLHDLAVSPGSAKVQSNAGAALAELGRHEEALEHYARAIEIAPGFAAPYRGSVLSLLALGRFQEAREMYRETLRFGPPVTEVEERIRAGLREGSARGSPDGSSP